MNSSIHPQAFFKGVLSHDKNLSFDINDNIIQLGVNIGRDDLFLKGLYKAFKNLDNEFDYKPMFGNPITTAFDYEKHLVKIKMNQNDFEFSFDSFLEFLSKIDMTFSPIYPLGTIVEIDETMLSEEWMELLDTDLEMRVILTGRKLPLSQEFSNYLVDYEAYLWPIGHQFWQLPILVSNMMIKRVIFKGFLDEIEENYAFNSLRAAQIIENQASSAFMTEKEAELFFEQVQGLS